MYKAGTVAEWRNLGLRGKIPDEVYQEATGIVTLLDDTFGAERDIDFERSTEPGRTCNLNEKVLM